MYFRYYCPTEVIFGRGSIKEVGQVVRNFGSRALLVVGRRFAKESGYLDKITKLLQEAGVEVHVFSGVEPNPSTETAQRCSEFARERGSEVIVAFGGGSVIDVGKAAAVVAVQGGRVEEYLYPKVVTGNALPIVAIPTTCGTGSEVTKNSVLTIVKEKRKVVVVGPAIIPKVAIVDPDVIRYLPPKLITWTAMDALSHALEAYVSKRSTPISDVLALEAIKLIIENVERAAKGDETAQEKLHLAATLAGMAINVAGTVLVHAMGYYLTTHHDVHHGLANALTLPYVLELDLQHIPRDKVEKLLHLLNVETVQDLIIKLCKLLDRVEIPNSVKDVGVQEEELETYVKHTLGYRRNLENNPIEVTEDIVRNLISKALSGRKGTYRYH
ncbi:MAG: hypothetical protein DRJ40_04805 [Thermoprotei archaeon]|nr:MAG: hypothetical protein DRJ40_04720 [Thermoprotei archaeon]RLE56723.1 MAG: hypothetical protein DRJ40_04805 [Thermoprotei archaeon]